ncbi:hypothetical protein [Brevundimonas diminuta]|uniref:hypothetical protein n=1 Tax=Brevundimonas diminuta TaxID=293 RepID=UPI0025A5A0DF|nr:hypothetical protein [Brevundimonas diminuta]MDM8352904.1 hypothetical protein [Brevundimonas diminuta]
MAAGRIIIPNYMPALDLNGNPVSGARLTFYQNETTDLASVYADASLTTPLANPVIADQAGVFPAIFADTASYYTVAISDGSGAPIGGLRNMDNIQPAESQNAKADRRAIDPKSAPYNAAGNGWSDDQSALEAAFAAVETVRVMDVPHGTFLLDGPLELTDTAATIRGTGEGSSTLRWAEPGGLSITNTDTNQNEVVIEGMRFEAAVEDAGTAVTIANPDLDAAAAGRTARLSNVYIGPAFGSSAFWNVGVDLTECREFIGDGLTLAGLGGQGVGLRINSDDFSTNYFIDKSWFFSWDKGIEFNQADVGADGAEGLHIQQGVFISCNTGIHWNCPDKPETLLMVEGSHFDCFYAGIDAEGCLQGLVVGCQLQLQFDSSSTGFGARFSESSEIIIASNVFHKPGTTGEWRPVRLVDTQHALVIGNTFEGYVEGVELNPGSSNIKILANDWNDRSAPPVAINGATNVNVQSFEGRTAMPSAGYWTRGEFVYNVEPSITNGMVQTGWRRLTTGNGHAAGTDWAAEYVAVDPVLRASLAWDPPSTPSGGQNYVDVTVTGAAVGDFAQASSPDSLSNLTLSATVTAANTVRVYLQNLTGSAVDVGSITIRVRVTK